MDVLGWLSQQESAAAASPEARLKLPPDYVQEGLALAAGTRILGVRLEDLSRDELVAVIGQFWKREDR